MVDSAEGEILIVGGNSFIGKALSDYLIKKKYQTISTFKDCKNKSASTCITIDLSNLDLSQIPSNIQVAYICAGITKKNDCENKPDFSNLVNVVNTVKLIEYLIKHNIHVVFLSTNEVFSGEKPYVKYNGDYAACSLYGKQKAEVERKIFGYQNISIVRLTKVFDKNSALLREWINSLTSGKSIQAFNDVNISPITLLYTINILSKIGLNKMSGKFQLSGETDITYFDFANLLATKLNLSLDLVGGVSCANIIGEENKRNYSSLNMNKEVGELKIKPQSIKQVIDEIIDV